MRIIDITHPPKILWIGRESENIFRPVSFECANWFSSYPNATIAAYYHPYGVSDPYPLYLTVDGTKRIWNPLAAELVKGNGELQIVLMNGDTVGTSAIIPTEVDRSLISNADHPASEAPSWAVKVVQDVTEQADRAEEAADHYPEIRDGYWWKWDAELGDWKDTHEPSKGEKGDTGDSVVDATYDGQTGTLTLIPGMPNARSCATPEMYGAKGDGVTDDTAAIQVAVNSGQNVAFGYKKTYKCGTINVTKNIEIDCRWSEFICTGETLFNCTGKVDSSVAGADYVASEPYALPEGDTYTGFAVLRSEDNIITERDYYYGGFVALFDNGVCNFRRPVSFSGVTVDKVTPITCVIRNVGVVTHPNNTYKNYTVYCRYGLGCLFDGFVVDGEKYSVINLKRCFRCMTRNVNGFASYTGEYENYYPVGGDESSECLFENCSLTSDWWCCFDIGGEILAFDNVVDNCKFHMGNGGIAIGSHANNIGFEIRNSEFDNGNFWGNSKIKNCKVYANAPAKDAGYNTCNVNFRATNLGMEANGLVVDGLEFVVSENNAPVQRSRFGLHVSCSGNRLQMHGNVGNISIKHVRVSDPSAVQFAALHIDSDSQNNSDLTFKGLIELEDIAGEIWIPAIETTIFESNCRMVIKDSKSRDNDGVKIGVSRTDAFPPDVSVDDCLISGIVGVFQTVRLSNVYQNGYAVAGTSFSGEVLIANNVGLIEPEAIKNFTNAKVVNMRYNTIQTWAFASVDSANGAYKVRYSPTGGVVKEEL